MKIGISHDLISAHCIFKLANALFMLQIRNWCLESLRTRSGITSGQSISSKFLTFCYHCSKHFFQWLPNITNSIIMILFFFRILFTITIIKKILFIFIFIILDFCFSFWIDASRKNTPLKMFSKSFHVIGK
jgi:hypothetical protein